jgi:hypothetical protein
MGKPPGRLCEISYMLRRIAKSLQGSGSSAPRTRLRLFLGGLRHRGEAWAHRRQHDLRLPNRAWEGTYSSSANLWKFTDQRAWRMMALGLLFLALDTLRLLKPLRRGS